MQWGDKTLMSDIFSSYLQKLQTFIWKWGRHKFINWSGRNKSTVPSWAHKFSLFGLTGIIAKHLKQGSENTFTFVRKNSHKQFLLRRPMASKSQQADIPVVSRFNQVQLFAILWTIDHQAPLSMGFPRPEHWSGLPCPPPGDLPDPETEPMSFMSPALTGRLFTTSANGAMQKRKARWPSWTD